RSPGTSRQDFRGECATAWRLLRELVQAVPFAEQGDHHHLGRAVEPDGRPVHADATGDVERHSLDVVAAELIALAEHGRGGTGDAWQANLAAVGVAGKHEERVVRDHTLGAVGLVPERNGRGVGRNVAERLRQVRTAEDRIVDADQPERSLFRLHLRRLVDQDGDVRLLERLDDTLWRVRDVVVAEDRPGADPGGRGHVLEGRDRGVDEAW